MMAVFAAAVPGLGPTRAALFSALFAEQALAFLLAQLGRSLLAQAVAQLVGISISANATDRAIEAAGNEKLPARTGGK